MAEMERITISIGTELKKELEAAAAQLGLSKSAFITVAIAEKLNLMK